MLRLRPGRRSRKTPVRYSGRDVARIRPARRSLTGLGIVPFIYVATGFPRFANYPFTPVQAYLGIAVVVAVCGCSTARITISAHNWSVSLDLRERHTLVTTGVYARIRHPMYTGFWLMALAQVLLLPNWIAGPAGFVGFGTLFFGRVGREEHMMINAFGEEYRSYMQRTARVVPWIY